MTQIIFDGKALAGKKEKILAKRVESFKKQTATAPKLVSFLVGDNPASKLYLRLKEAAAQRVGIAFEKREFSSEAGLEIILASIRQANDDKTVHGVMAQLPIIAQNSKLKTQNHSAKLKDLQTDILTAIDPRKDIDCLTPENLGLLLMGEPRFLPATVRGVLFIIYQAVRKQFDNSTIRQSDNLTMKQYNNGAMKQFDNEAMGQWINSDSGTAKELKPLLGLNTVVVGASDIVGKPLAMMLSAMGATVTICRRTTENLSDSTKRADILISATGVPGLIRGDMVKRGAVVIDVGSPRGDVDFEEVKNIASFITPVPGGVGPLTVISLLENTLEAARNLWH